MAWIAVIILVLTGNPGLAFIVAMLLILFG